MSYQTLEVELENGQVRPNQAETLPAKAHALLTILNASEAGATTKPLGTAEAGLRRFLSHRDFSLTPEQSRASMAADFWEP
jgi:hypothetical protein